MPSSEHTAPAVPSMDTVDGVDERLRRAGQNVQRARAMEDPALLERALAHLDRLLDARLELEPSYRVDPRTFDLLERANGALRALGATGA